MEHSEIYIKSTLDGSMQPSLFISAKGKKRPLLVGLHTWSYDRFNQLEKLSLVAKEHNFNILLPEFRGANLDSNPHCTLACGSEYAKRDIKDAIDYVCGNYDIDTENIFLFGESGGGHMALLMAAYLPRRFKAIASSVPISDLKWWAEQSPSYAKHVFACCSGSDEEMAKRSPISYIDEIAKANLKIFHGKFDNCVPSVQSITLFNKIMEKYPSARVFLDIFDGGHETDMICAVHWLITQYGENTKKQVTG